MKIEDWRADFLSKPLPGAGHPVRRLRSAAAVVDESKARCARLEAELLNQRLRSMIPG
jgi:hypothetical protein